MIILKKLTPLQDQAYELMKQKLMENYYKPGVIYSLTKTAANLGFSRTPVKDAMTRLANELYIDIIPSKGFMLHEMSESEMTNTYQVRCALESFAAMELAQNKSPEAKKHLKKMQTLLDRMGASIVDGEITDAKALVKNDTAFHRELVLSLNNARITSLFDEIDYPLHQIAAQTLATSKQRPLESYQEHFAILEAIKSGSVTDAYDAVTKHLNNTRFLFSAVVAKSAETLE